MFVFHVSPLSDGNPLTHCCKKIPMAATTNLLAINHKTTDLPVVENGTVVERVALRTFTLWTPVTMTPCATFRCFHYMCSAMCPQLIIASPFAQIYRDNVVAVKLKRKKTTPSSSAASILKYCQRTCDAVI